MFNKNIPEKFQWFVEAKYGVFIHWGPYSVFEKGEQVLFRDHMEHSVYEKRAREWNPTDYDPVQWAQIFKKSGFKYACLTTRHHDGYCLWDTQTTDYNSSKLAPSRDLVREFTEAMRAAGIKVGLYYSWCDWRLPEYYDGTSVDSEEWKKIKTRIWTQVEELMTQYGQVDYLFFDGTWPRNALEIGSRELVEKIRIWQPNIIINNRLGFLGDQTEIDKYGGLFDEGDFSTPEQNVFPQDRIWESCQTATWRWWGYAKNERYKSTDEMLKLLCECVSKGGNLIMNVGPKPDGSLPEEFTCRSKKIGEWLDRYGECIYGVDGGDLTEFATCGYQTIKKNSLYLIFNIWSGEKSLRLTDLPTKVESVQMLGEKGRIYFQQTGDELILSGLPAEVSTDLFPVIKIDFSSKPETTQWGASRQWRGDPKRIAEWRRTTI